MFGYLPYNTVVVLIVFREVILGVDLRVLYMGMVYHCEGSCQRRSKELGDLTGKSHDNPEADYLNGEECEKCGGTIEALPE